MMVCLECGGTAIFNIDAACPRGWARNVMDAIQNAAQPPELITIITAGDASLTTHSSEKPFHTTLHTENQKRAQPEVRNELNRK